MLPAAQPLLSPATRSVSHPLCPHPSPQQAAKPPAPRTSCAGRGAARGQIWGIPGKRRSPGPAAKPLSSRLGPWAGRGLSIRATVNSHSQIVLATKFSFARVSNPATLCAAIFGLLSSQQFCLHKQSRAGTSVPLLLLNSNAWSNNVSSPAQVTNIELLVIEAADVCG